MPEVLFQGGAGSSGGQFFSGGVSNLGNTAGTTGVAPNQLVLVGGSNVTLSQSSVGGGATVTVNAGGADLTLLQYPIAPWGWSTAGVLPASGSTSANGASTHSTMSYYVQPYYIDHPVQASMIQLISSAQLNAGTGSVTHIEYLGLYKLSSDSLTLVSSWLAGNLYSQNSDTQVTLVQFTGSASASVSSIATAVAGASGASKFVSGVRLMSFGVGASSLIQPDQYFAVIGNYSTGGSDVFRIAYGVQPNSYAPYGQSTLAAMWAPLNGAFSSTSMTNIANSNQWLMPPAVATSDITATASGQMLRPPIMFRGI